MHREIASSKKVTIHVLCKHINGEQASPANLKSSVSLCICLGGHKLDLSLLIGFHSIEFLGSWLTS